jgi:hypothetical protein
MRDSRSQQGALELMGKCPAEEEAGLPLQRLERKDSRLLEEITGTLGFSMAGMSYGPQAAKIDK